MSGSLILSLDGTPIADGYARSQAPGHARGCYANSVPTRNRNIIEMGCIPPAPTPDALLGEWGAPSVKLRLPPPMV